MITAPRVPLPPGSGSTSFSSVLAGFLEDTFPVLWGKIGLPRVALELKTPAKCRRVKRRRLSPQVRKVPWRRKWQPTSVLLPWRSHGQRSLVDHSPRGHRAWDTTEWLSPAQIRGLKQWHIQTKLLKIVLKANTLCSFSFPSSSVWIYNYLCGSFPPSTTSGLTE